MKKLLALCLALTMLLGLLAGCGSSSSEAEETTEESAAVEETAEEAEDSEEDAEEASEEASEDASEETSEEASEETASEEGGYTGMTAEENEAMFPLEENVTYSIYYPFAPPLINMGYDDPAELNYYQTLEEMTNVTLEFTTVSVESMSENFNLMVVSQEYCDIFSQCTDEYTGGMAGMLKDEVIIDLTDYIAKYAPHYSALLESREDLAKNAKTDDGQIGQFMCVYENSYVNQGYFMNMDWLEEQGLDMPVTYDDWFEVLSAFKVAYDMELPSAGVPTTGFYGVPKDNFVVRDGEVVYIYTDEEIQSQYLELCKKWFDAGLYTSEVLLDNYYTDSDLRGMITSKDLLLTTDDIDNFALYSEEFTIEPVSAPVVNEGDTPYQSIRQETVGNGNAITVDCDDVETLVSYMDYWYSDEVIQLANWGTEGETYTTLDDGSYTYTDEVLNFSGGLNLALSVYAAGWEPTVIDWDRKNVGYDDAQLEALEIWNEFDTSMNYPGFISFTTEETDTIQTIYTDIETYTDEHYTMFQIGQATYEDDFQEFCDTLYDMGLQEIIDIYQAAYDRYMAR